MSPVILVMLDGISADYLARHRAALPNLSTLAREGLYVERVAADVPATSLPGRTSILTGVPARQHGVHGNVIWDGERFRYANPDDVRVPTLPRRAADAGLDVAVIGFGMVRPEDATVFRHAWWVNEMLQRARDEEPVPADEGWLRTARHGQEDRRVTALAAEGYPDAALPDPYAADEANYLLAGAAGDHAMMRWSAGLLTSASPPDLVLTEVLLTDSVQHRAGSDHPFAHATIGYADALVGTLLHALERAGRRDGTTVAITSDHGHGDVSDAIYAERILPGRALAPEGSLLFVSVDDEREARSVGEALREHGIERLDGTFLPDDVRDAVTAFVAPDGAVFEMRPGPHQQLGGDATTGPAKYASSHGFRPGHPADERFLIVRGPTVRPGTVTHAAAADVEATVASLVGLSPSGEGSALT